MADPRLATFAPALLRLILCGGGGLPAAWGPLISDADPVDFGFSFRWPWDPTEESVHPRTGRGDDKALMYPGEWRLPLNHWRARLAVVAAWMLDIGPSFAADVTHYVIPSMGLDHVEMVLGRTDAPYTIRWDSKTGRGTFTRHIDREWMTHRDLPTLPHHLLTHDPAVALLLALYDVSEIRARVEALYA